VTEAALDALELEIRKLSVMIAALVAIRRELSLDKRTLPRCGKRKKPAAWSRV
jgi:hypothetical protein